MGQYHYLVNINRRQFVHPNRIANGLKLREQVNWPYATATALVMLLAGSIIPLVCFSCNLSQNASNNQNQPSRIFNLWKIFNND